MKPAPFKYIVARSVDEALAAKSNYGDEARFLAGGQSLVPMMNFRMSSPAVVIDINLLSELSGVQGGIGLRIGAMTRYRMIEADPAIARGQPILLDALPHIAHPQIRNRGTLGGNLAHADPASEMPAIVVALGGIISVRSRMDQRRIPARDFFIGALQSAIRDDEMLIAVELAEHPPNTGACFLEIARRRGDFAIAGVAAILTFGPDGLCRDASLAYCGVADRPFDGQDAARVLIGSDVSEDSIRQAADRAMRAIDPPGTPQASAGYQRHVAGVLTRRALAKAKARALLEPPRGSRGH